MKKSEVVKAWGSILAGRPPSLSIEITKECPLRCPGCYAFEAGHLGGEMKLKELSDFKGEDLVRNVLRVVDEIKPLHVSIVGGDPLVRYRELEQLLPQMVERGVHTQVVTSAFRVIPAAWAQMPLVSVVVSIDGLQPEHDVRRAPATYERILKNIVDAKITIHSTITSQIASRPGYLQEFLEFWCARPQVNKVWFSLFTPQRGATDVEILSPMQRLEVMEELFRLRVLYPKLDMQERVIKEIATPPQNPEECIFARTTQTISADLTTQITPVPVWRGSGLLAVRLHCVDGAGGGRALSSGWKPDGGADLHGVGPGGADVAEGEAGVDAKAGEEGGGGAVSDHSGLTATADSFGMTTNARQKASGEARKTENKTHREAGRKGAGDVSGPLLLVGRRRIGGAKCRDLSARDPPQTSKGARWGGCSVEMRALGKLPGSWSVIWLRGVALMRSVRGWRKVKRTMAEGGFARLDEGEVSGFPAFRGLGFWS